ncbi:MAG: response regulator [bacterium]
MTKILVVEDEKNLLKAMQEMLVKNKYQVVTASNGKEGLAKLSVDLDLVILDIVMPEMDGMTMFDELRKIPEYQNMPVIVLTNWTSDDAKIKTQKLGAIDYLIKSDWDISQIIVKINAIVSKIKKNKA